MSCGDARGTLRGVQRHRNAGTRTCPECRRPRAAERLMYRVMRGDQKGCYVPLLLLAELLRCATPEVLLLAEETLAVGIVGIAEEWLRLREDELAQEEKSMDDENPPTLPCPYDCGAQAESQGGSSYYICPCGEEFDRDELDEHGRIRSE